MCIATSDLFALRCPRMLPSRIYQVHYIWNCDWKHFWIISTSLAYWWKKWFLNWGVRVWLLLFTGKSLGFLWGFSLSWVNELDMWYVCPRPSFLGLCWAAPIWKDILSSYPLSFVWASPLGFSYLKQFFDVATGTFCMRTCVYRSKFEVISFYH